jgi:hypothetical protein
MRDVGNKVDIVVCLAEQVIADDTANKEKSGAIFLGNQYFYTV